MNAILAIDDRLYLLLNRLSGQTPILDLLISLPMDNNLVKAGPVCAAFFFAWFSGSDSDRVGRRSLLMATLAALILIIAVTKPLGQSIFAPRPMARSFTMVNLQGDRLVEAERLTYRKPLAGGTSDQFEAMQRGEITANDMGSFPSDHAALFIALSLGILLACRRAGYVALGWTVIVILLTRVITGLHSPIDILAGTAIGAGILFLCLFAARRWAGNLLGHAAQWTMRQESLSSALLFLAIFEIGNLLENLEQLARTGIQMLRALKSLLGALLALLLAGCGLDQDGGLVLLEKGWRAEIIATDKSGIVSPDGLFWDGKRLLIADEGGSAVRAWVPGGGFATLADERSGLSRPEDIASDAAGNIYYTDDNQGGMWRTSPDGKTVHLVTPRQGVGTTEGLALAPFGRLLVGDAEHNRIVSVGAGGDIQTFLPASAGVAKPESLAFAPDGGLYIADNATNIIYLLTADGRLRRCVADLETFSPESIYHSGEALFVTDSENGKLYRYTPEGGLEPIIIFGGDLRKVQGITGDAAGNLYVSIQTQMRGGVGYLLRLSRSGTKTATR